MSLARRDHRKSKFGLRHAIKLISMIPPSKRHHNVPQGRVNCQTRAARAAWAACMEKIYEIPRAGAARALCADPVLFKSTVPGIYSCRSRSKFRSKFRSTAVYTHGCVYTAVDLPDVYTAVCVHLYYFYFFYRD